MRKKIIAHGNSILKEEGEWIEEGHEGLEQLIEDMFETMDGANGIGLAAQQIGLALKIFVLDLSHHGDHTESLKGFRKVFLNSEILEEGKEKI